MISQLTHPFGQMAATLEDDIFKWIFLYENGIVKIQISLKYVPKSPVAYKPVYMRH